MKNGINFTRNLCTTSKSGPNTAWSSIRKQRDFLESVKQRLNVKTWKDWYRVTGKDLINIGGRGLLSKYNFSPSKLLTSVYPNNAWNISHFKTVPQSFWKDRKNQKDFLESIKSDLGVKTWRDWYKMKNRTLIEAGGKVILLQYGSSPSKMIMSLYPEHDWNISEFGKVPQSFWRDPINQKNFLNEAKKKLNIKTWRDWYGVTRSKLIKLKGGSLLDLYGNSPSKLITSIYPNHPWKTMKFKNVPQKHWQNINNHREFLESVKSKLDIRDWKDWYRITQKDIIDAGGGGLSNRFKNSPSKIITSAYPEYPWDITEFTTVTRSFWKSLENQKNFLESAKKKLKVEKWEDWYRVGGHDLVRIGGARLLNLYQGSPSKLFPATFPEHPWKPFLFNSKLLKWDSEIAKSFLDWIALQQRIRSPLDWRTISVTQVHESRGGNSLLNQTGSLQKALKLAYPMNDWENLLPSKLSIPQGMIVTILSQYIPRSKMIINYRHPRIVHLSGKIAELDVWIPSMNLGIEYHGEHHYHQVSQEIQLDLTFFKLWEKSQHPSIRKTRDAEKRELCKKNGIDLVEVPYWWDKNEEQLIGVIRSVKPDFLIELEKFDSVQPISISISIIEFSAKANEWNRSKDDPKMWWVSEKMDGHRACWDGKGLYSRNHNTLSTPVPLPMMKVNKALVDGELWHGRKTDTHKSIMFHMFDILEATSVP